MCLFVRWPTDQLKHVLCCIEPVQWNVAQNDLFAELKALFRGVPGGPKWATLAQSMSPGTLSIMEKRNDSGKPNWSFPGMFCDFVTPRFERTPLQLWQSVSPKMLSELNSYSSVIEMSTIFQWFFIWQIVQKQRKRSLHMLNVAASHVQFKFGSESELCLQVFYFSFWPNSASCLLFCWFGRLEPFHHLVVLGFDGRLLPSKLSCIVKVVPGQRMKFVINTNIRLVCFEIKT